MLDSSHTLSVRYLDISLEQLFVTPLYTNVFYHDNDLIHSDLRQSILHISNTPNAIALKTTYVMPDAETVGKLQVKAALGKILLVADDSLFLCLSLLNKVTSLITPIFSSTVSDVSAQATSKAAEVSVPLRVPTGTGPASGVGGAGGVGGASGVGAASVASTTSGVGGVGVADVASTTSTASTASTTSITGTTNTTTQTGIPSLSAALGTTTLSTPPSSPPQQAMFSIAPLLSPNSLHVVSQVVESFNPLDSRKTDPANSQTPAKKEETVSPIPEEADSLETTPRESGYRDIEMEIVSNGVELSMYRLLNSTLFVKGRRDDSSLLFHLSFISVIALTKSGGSTTISMDVNDASIELGSKDDTRVLLCKEMNEVSGIEETALIHLSVCNKSDIHVDLNQLSISLDAPALVDSLTVLLGVLLRLASHP